MFKNRFYPMMAPDTGGGYGEESDFEDLDDDELEDGSEEDEDNDEDDEEGDEYQPEEDEPDDESQPAYDPPEQQLSPEAARIAELERQNQFMLQSTFGGQVNPYTGRPISDFNEFEAYVNAEAAKELEKVGLPPDYLETMINNHPAIQRANQMVEAQQQAAFTAMINKELADIQKVNPDIKTTADLLKLPRYEVFEALVKGGMHIDKAYRVHSEMTQKNNESKPSGKDHLKSFNGQEGSMIDGPSKQEMDLYRKINPGVSDKEIRSHYKKMKKEEGR